MIPRVKPWGWLLLSILASAVSWSYMHRILLPWEYYVNVKRGWVKAQMGDLYPRWLGTRELLLHGRNPYGSDVSHEIQTAFYGHPIEQSYNKPASEIIDEQRFVYPVYVVLLLAPTVHVNFATLQAWAPFTLGGLTALGIWLWLRVLRWRPHVLVTVSLVLLVLSSPQIAQGLRLRQFGLLVAFLIALATWCVTREQYGTAGLLLAVSTIKPQMVAFCVLWFLVWSLGNLRKRWTLAAGLGLALAVLCGFGEWLVPRWPIYFVQGLDAYRKYFPTTSPLRLILGDWIGGAISILIVIWVMAIGWKRRAVDSSSPEFVHTLSLFLLATTLVLPLVTPYNQVLLLLPIVMLFREWYSLPRWGRAGLTALIAWPWVSSAIMLMRPPRLDSMSRLPLLPAVLVLLFPLVVPVLMYFRQPTTASS